MPWEKQYDRDDVLERATVAFWRHGYEGTSVADLVAATGLHKGSLYAGFGGKRALFAAALRHYDKRYRQDFLQELQAKPSPRAAILEAFCAAAEPRADRPPGCLTVNTALEMAPHDSEARAWVQDSFDGLSAFFHACATAARDKGEIAPDLDPDAVATTLLGLFLGLRVLARSGAEQAMRTALITQAEAILRRP